MATLKSNLTHIALQAPELASEALLETAAVIVDVAKQIVPVDTGALKQSLGADPVDSHTVQIGSDKDYAPYVEYGTSRQSPQPYLTPAFTQSEDTFKAIMERKMKEVS